MNKLYILTFFAVLACQGRTQEPMSDTPSPGSASGVVSAASPEATDAGVAILNMGGNAVDAAIAVQFALAVTEPAMSGLGGGTQVLLSLPGRRPIAINGASISPRLTPTDATEDDLTYHRRSTIPSTVKVMGYLYKQYGSGKVTWRDMLQPAIYYATHGFQVGVFRHKVYRQYQSQLEGSPHHTNLFLKANGSIPGPGELLRQPILAETLQRIAEGGADEFYEGTIAQEIATDMEANGGWITLEDLNNFPDPVEMEPVTTNYRGFDVYSQPPPCGGWTALLMLNMMEQSSPSDLQPETASRFEHVLTAIHLAHRNRKQYPVSGDADLASRLDKQHASQLLRDFQLSTSIEDQEPEGGETTHYSVADNDGMAVAVTSSINAYFGAKAATSTLGFLYNSYMDDFEIGQPDHPFGIGPGKMNYSSMSPTIVQRDGTTQLVIGSPGSARIISSVAQLVQLSIDTDLGIEEIVAMPRLHAVNGSVYYEDLQTPHEWVQPFESRGMRTAYPSYNLTSGELNAYFGGVHAIQREGGHWVGAADPRRDGAVGYSN